MGERGSMGAGRREIDPLRWREWLAPVGWRGRGSATADSWGWVGLAELGLGDPGEVPARAAS